MLRQRIIPCLLLTDGKLVKTTKFSNEKYVGDPINAIRIFNEKEVDELIVLDIDASKKKREPDYALIERFAGECFMPLCYGGGIRTEEQAKTLFSLGVEKLCLQTAAYEDVTFITRLTERFGSQSIVVSLDVKKNWRGVSSVYCASSKSKLRGDWLVFAEQMITAGAGELVLNAVDLDGTRSGMDLALIHQASNRLGVPLIAMGGAGNLKDIKAAIKAGASAVAAGSMFVFHGPHRAVLITYPKYSELEI